MATFRRSITPGATYFFTVVTYRRQAVLTDPPCYRALREAFRKTKLSHPFAVEALVLPDHLHCIWTLPLNDADYSTRWRLIKTRFARNVPTGERLSARRHKAGERGIWQRRFWEHAVRDEKDFAAHVDYIHYNPVKHGHVRAAVDWPYSSIHRYIERGDLGKDWAADPGALESGHE